jgi:hypothetical protein
MKRLVLSAFALAFAVTPVLAQQIGGRYTVEGTNLDGSSYGGEAQINLTSDTTCEIGWITGDTTSIGICMKNQNAFAAAYVLGNATGLVIYEILPNGTLEGIWTISGQNGSGTERLTPQ